MRKNLILAALILALIAGLTLLLDDRRAPPVHTLDESAVPSDLPVRPAPDFALKDLRGRHANLKDFRGRIVVLHFWATWCPPCIAEFPKLVGMAGTYPDRLVLLALSSDDDADVIKSFVRKTSPQSLKRDNIYLVWDKNRALTHDVYQTFAYPETIIIGADGRMLRKIPGDADWTAPEMKSYLESLIPPLAKRDAKP